MYLKEKCEEKNLVLEKPPVPAPTQTSTKKVSMLHKLRGEARGHESGSVQEKGPDDDLISLIANTSVKSQPRLNRSNVRQPCLFPN